jgi:hypothetical protein
MNSENLAKTYVIENKIVSLSLAARVMEKNGVKNEANFP